MTTSSSITQRMATELNTAASAHSDSAQNINGQALYQQASQSQQPDVLVTRQFEQNTQTQKTKLADEFVSAAGRDGVKQLAATPDGQHALAAVYNQAGGDARKLMQEVHKEQGNTAVDYTKAEGGDGLEVESAVRYGIETFGTIMTEEKIGLLNDYFQAQESDVPRPDHKEKYESIQPVIDRIEEARTGCTEERSILQRLNQNINKSAVFKPHFQSQSSGNVALDALKGTSDYILNLPTTAANLALVALNSPAIIISAATDQPLERTESDLLGAAMSVAPQLGTLAELSTLRRSIGFTARGSMTLTSARLSQGKETLREAYQSISGERRVVEGRVDDPVDGATNLDDVGGGRSAVPGVDSNAGDVASLTSRNSNTMLDGASAPDNSIMMKVGKNVPDKLLNTQLTSQKANTNLLSSLKQANPTLSNREIADLAKSKLQVLEVPFGFTRESFASATNSIKARLAELGIDDVSGFATGSRVTGVTTNPKKASKFGLPVDDFSKTDLDVTLVTSKRLTKQQKANLSKEFKNDFGIKLGIRNIADAQELKHIPVFGKIDFEF